MLDTTARFTGLDTEEAAIRRQYNSFAFNLRRFTTPEGTWPEQTGDIISGLIKGILNQTLVAIQECKRGNITKKERDSLTTFRHQTKRPTGKDLRTQNVDLSGMHEGTLVFTTKTSRTIHSPYKPIRTPRGPSQDKRTPAEAFVSGARMAFNAALNFLRFIGQGHYEIEETLTITPAQALLHINCVHRNVLDAYCAEALPAGLSPNPQIGFEDKGKTTLDLPSTYIEYVIDDPPILDRLLIVFAQRVHEAIDQNKELISGPTGIDEDDKE